MGLTYQYKGGWYMWNVLCFCHALYRMVQVLLYTTAVIGMPTNHMNDARSTYGTHASRPGTVHS